MRSNLFFVIGAACIGSAPAPAITRGGPPALVQILPDDGEAGDSFGFSVAVSGEVAVIGAYADDSTASNSGSAYLFDAVTGQQLFKLTPDDGGMFDEFGYAVGISGGTAIISADSDGGASGSAYLFNVATGQQLFKLLADDGAAEDHFGRSVAVSGGFAVVGAIYDDDHGSASGSAYLFDVTTGQQVFKMTPGDGAVEDRFGGSIAVSGRNIIIGAYGDDDQGGDSGSAYVFDAVTGNQLRKLLPDDGAAGDRFGYSVAVSGQVAIVGSYLDDDNGDRSGAAYIFNIATGQQLFKLTPDDGAARDEFGYSVAISGAVAFIGAWGDDDNSGAAYRFDVGTGQQVFKTAPDDGATSDRFGGAVAASGALAIVGAFADDDQGFASGSAYLVNEPPPPSITMSPASVLVGPAPTTVVFEAAATSLYPVTYQWRRDAQPMTNSDNISGVSTPTLTILATQADIGLYDCQATNDYGSVHSGAAVLGFRPNPCPADLTGDGMINFFDVSAYLSEYNAGCP